MCDWRNKRRARLFPIKKEPHQCARCKPQPYTWESFISQFVSFPSLQSTYFLNSLKLLRVPRFTPPAYNSHTEPSIKHTNPRVSSRVIDVFLQSVGYKQISTATHGHAIHMACRGKFSISPRVCTVTRESGHSAYCQTEFYNELDVHRRAQQYHIIAPCLSINYIIALVRFPKITAHYYY